jgi:hypothetical protein
MSMCRFVLIFAVTLCAAPGLSAQSASAGEQPATADLACFADPFLTQLKPGVTAEQVSAIGQPALRKVAEELLAGTFRAAERKRECRAYEPLQDLAKRLKTSTYSQFENPTGVFFEEGEEVVAVVAGLGGEPASLRIRNFGPREADETLPLRNGINLLRAQRGGLAYVNYYTPGFRNAPAITVSLVSGRVNGVFNAATGDTAEWQRLLACACAEVIDLVGERVHLIYPVKELRQFCPDGKRMVDLYDSIIRDQHQLMGLDKYSIVPTNRMLGRAIWRGYMHADGFGAAFHHETMRNLADPERIPTNSWGIAHEFGHVNQTRPGMKWVSTTEVTNNIFSCWTNFRLNPGDMRLEHERINGGDGDVTGGRFNAFLNSALVAKEPWLCQRGPDKMEGYENGGDHFVKVVPLWQLQLYFGVARRGNPDFYADIFHKVRQTDESGLSNGRLQLNFMRNACDVAKLDLTHFFTRIGMLVPIDRNLDDYTRGQLTITAADCAELARHAARYPKPDSPVIFYISANSVAAFRDRLPVSGTHGEGVSGTGTTRVIDHKVWQNTVAFETYRGRDLVRIAMTGTGSKDNTSTLVQFPDGATRIEAVSWDGKRTVVLGRR